MKNTKTRRSSSHQIYGKKLSEHEHENIFNNSEIFNNHFFRSNVLFFSACVHLLRQRKRVEMG